MQSFTGKQQAERESFLVELADSAADVILPFFRAGAEVENKSQSRDFDPVTRADREAEAVIRDAIRKKYPNDTIIGEEYGEELGSSDVSWVIDPIDGTRAFICGLPTWAVLIGICVAGQPLIGTMYQPLTGDRFIGGCGRARLEGRHESTELKTSDIQQLEQASLFATTPSMFSKGHEANAFARVSASVKLTRFGVDSYAYCLLAAGHIDLVIEADLGFYDIAAVIPLIESAGGVVSDWGASPVRDGGRVIAAANPTLHELACRYLTD